MLEVNLSYLVSQTKRKTVNLLPYFIDTTTTTIKDSLNIVQQNFGSGFVAKFSIVVDNKTNLFTENNGFLTYPPDTLELNYRLDGVDIFNGICININEDFKQKKTTLTFEDLRTKYKDIPVQLTTKTTFFEALSKVYEAAGFDDEFLLTELYNQDTPQSNIETLLLAIRHELFFSADENLENWTIGQVLNRCFDIGVFISGDLKNIVFLGVIFWTPSEHYRNVQKIGKVIDIQQTKIIRNREWNALIKTEKRKVIDIENDNEETEIDFETVFNLLVLPENFIQNASNTIYLSNYHASGVKAIKVAKFFNHTFATMLLMCGLKNRRILTLTAEPADNLILGSIFDIDFGAGGEIGEMVDNNRLYPLENRIPINLFVFGIQYFAAMDYNNRVYKIRNTGYVTIQQARDAQHFKVSNPRGYSVYFNFLKTIKLAEQTPGYNEKTIRKYWANNKSERIVGKYMLYSKKFNVKKQFFTLEFISVT